MKKIFTTCILLCSLLVSALAVTVNDVAGTFKGNLKIGSTPYNNIEVYVLPGTADNTFTLVFPSVPFSSKSNDLVLVDMTLNSNGTLSAGSAAAYVKQISASSLSASSMSFTFSVTTPAMSEPATVAFSGSKSTDKNYAITNGGFEGNWSGNEPTGWHSFVSASGDYASFVTANTGQFQQSTDKRPGSTGSYSAQIQSKVTLGVKANGNCTNGRINAGSMSATDASGNYAYSDPSQSGYNTPFAGSPDSLVFWAKYVPGGGEVTDASNKARAHATLLTNARYQDPETKDYSSVKIAEAASNYSATSDKGWQRISVPFEYTSVSTDLTAYILVTFTTNQTPGGGNSTKKNPDNVYLDDAEVVYNHSLTSFTLNGTAISFTNGAATTSQVFSDIDYTTATTTNGKAAKSFIGYDATNNRVAVYVVANNYSQARAYSLYTLQMAEPIRDTYYEYTASTCDNEPYSDNLFTNLTKAGEYHTTIPNTQGGDSIITLTLTILPTYAISATDTINMDKSYTWRGNTYENLVPGEYTYTDALKTKAGCDSIFTLTLTVKAIPYAFSETMTACLGEEAEWHGKVLPTDQVGTFTVKDEHKSIYDTDSIYTLTLTVLPTYIFPTEASVNMDETYSWRGKEYKNLTPGLHLDTVALKTVAGCDSIFTLTLTVNSIGYVFREESTACQNEEAVWHSKALPTDKAGTVIVYDSLKSVYGEDSVYVLTLTVHPTYRFEETKYVNEADLIWRGKTIKDLPQRKEPYLIYDSLLTKNGCDSIYVLVLHVSDVPITYGTYEAATCDGDYIIFEGVKYREAFEGDILVSTKNVYGGDSIVHLTVIILPTYTIDEYMTITVGDNAEWEGWNLSTMPEGNMTLSATYYTDDDCDSTMVLHLTVLPIDFTGLEEINSSSLMGGERGRLVLINGQLFIIRKDEVYDILGKKINKSHLNE